MASPIIGYIPSTKIVGGDHWCAAAAPVSGWSLLNCPGQTGVLTYNLFWWNLFGMRGGAGGSSGKLIASSGSQLSYDFMGFQECEDIARVLRDGHLLDVCATIPGELHWQWLTINIYGL